MFISPTSLPGGVDGGTKKKKEEEGMKQRRGDDWEGGDRQVKSRE